MGWQTKLASKTPETEMVFVQEDCPKKERTDFEILCLEKRSKKRGSFRRRLKRPGQECGG
jgi:hypothetical protein